MFRLISDYKPWIEAIIDGRWVEAKVYNEPSMYGIDKGRVSKLAISKTANRDSYQPFLDQMAFNYDRGLDFDNLGSPQLLSSIIQQLENFRISNPC